MAIGDDASAAGYPLVPNTGEGGQVRHGAREINRTRDFVAQVKELLPEGIDAFQEASGILKGPNVPDNTEGIDGQIFLRIL